MPRRDFMYIFIGHAESRLNDRTFRSYDRHLVIHIIVGWANAVGIAKQEGISLSHHAAHGISAIPWGCRLAKDTRQLEVIHLVHAALWLAMAIDFFSFFMQALVFFVQEMPNFFHHGDGVGPLFGMLAQRNQLIHQLLHIGHVKIPSNDQIATHPVALAQKRVASFNRVSAIGAVSEVT